MFRPLTPKIPSKLFSYSIQYTLQNITHFFTILYPKNTLCLLPCDVAALISPLYGLLALEFPLFPPNAIPFPLLYLYVPGDAVAVVSVVPPPLMEAGVQLPPPIPLGPYILGVEFVDKDEWKCFGLDDISGAHPRTARISSLIRDPNDLQI